MTETENTPLPTKPWYLSKTFVGIGVIAIAAVLRAFDVEVGTEDVAEITQYLMEGVGLVLTIVGRATARTQITR